MKKKLTGILALVLIITSSLGSAIIAEDSNDKKEEIAEVVNLDGVSDDLTDTQEDTEDETLEEEVTDEEETLTREDVLGSVHVKIMPSSESVEIGNIAQYRIFLHVDGRQEYYKNAKLVISLPSQINGTSIVFDQPLSELEIRGVTPVYDETNQKLSYTFDSLEGGFETSLLLNIKTRNGYSLNGEILTMNAVITSDEILKEEASSSVTLIANQNASVSNKLSGIIVDDELQDRSSIRYLDEAVFSIGVSVNKYVTGSLATKKDSTVSVSYTLAEGLEYVSDTSGITPTVDGNTYTWIFDSKLNESSEYFFASKFDVRVKVVGDLTLFSKVINTVSADITYTDDSSKTYTVDASVLISPNFEYTLPEFTEGSAYTSIFSGPADAIGGTGWIANDDISVTDGALLGWNIYMTPLSATSGEYGMNAYNVFFHPDENLNLKRFYSGNFYFRPSSGFADGALLPLDEPVYYSLSVKYTDSEDWIRAKETIVPETYYTPEELGIDTTKTVKTMWFHFHNNERYTFADDVGFRIPGTSDASIFDLPAGLTSTNMRLWTTIDEGYVGSIASNLGIAYSGWNNDTYRTSVQSMNVPEELRNDEMSDMPSGYESRLSTKTAQVVTPPEGISRYVKGNVYLTNATNNLVQAGENTLRLQIINDEASLRQLKGPFEAYVLVGSGIEVNDLTDFEGGTAEVIDRNYKGTGKTLVKIHVESTGITTAAKETRSIPVTINDNAPYKLSIELIGFINEDYNVSDVSNTNGTFTVKEKDIYDLNGNNDIEEYVYATRNTYTYLNAYEYYGILGVSNGTDIKNTITVHNNESVSLDLGIFNAKNRPISSLVLIGVLPSIDDTGVLSDAARNSKFDMKLTGPITLPDAYKNSFDVYYSTSKEPSVAGVLDVNTAEDLDKLVEPTRVDDAPWLKENEVTDFSTIASYKIVMKDTVAPIIGTELHFTAQVKIGNNSLVGDEAIDQRIAYSSFAVGVNNATVFETQTVNFIFEKTPEYLIKANDVKMKLTDVKKMIADGSFDAFVKEQANPLVYKNNVEVEEADIAMLILDRPAEFVEGEFVLSFAYTNESGIVTATTQSKLIIEDDSKPTEPTEAIEPTDPTLPSTGMDSSNLVIGTGLVLVLFGVVLHLFKRKDA